MPEDIEPAGSIEEAMALYRESAKSHNHILTDYLRLKEQYEWLQRQMFGTRSEKLHKAPQDPQGKPPGQAPGGGSPPDPSLVRNLKTPKKTTAFKGHGWGTLPDHLERVDIHVPLSHEQQKFVDDAKGQGLAIEQIREEITERLAMRPQTLYVKRFIRPVFALKGADGSSRIVTTSLPEMPVEKGRADLSILIFLAVAKFVDHLPVDRIRKIFLRQDVKLRNSTLGDWLESLHDMLLPVYLAMADAVKKSDIIHTDDTIVRVIRDDKKHKTHKGRMWVYIGGGHWVYEYTPTRGGANPSRFLEGFKGKLQADGYAGYNAVTERDTVVRVGCHSHVRRYFEKAVAHYPEAMEILDFYRQLFEIERNCTENKSSPLRRRRIRILRSRPLLDAMKTWMEAKKINGLLPKDSLGEAIGYTLPRWVELEEFLKDGNLPLSNNISEMAMRGVVLGRKNYLFFGSEESAQRGAVFYSVLHSCVCLGINPEEYLFDIITRMADHPQKRISDLTPVGWLAARPLNPLP